ncbi:MAG: hypothetical protein IPP29_06490 [Bacteroidetes bacterium]|nr:hypothetical protein [Bacteroidota bacterium]
MEKQLIIDFLQAFFSLFKASIEDFKIVEKKVFGIVGWLNEEDKQNFVLKIDFDTSPLTKAKLLCDFLFENDLINGDTIIVSENDLILKLIENKWVEIDAKESINFLCSFDVKMLDDGEETDSFYIHF